MLLASDFRRIARESLNNRWGLAIGTGFVASLLGASISGGSSGSGSNNADTISDMPSINFNLFSSDSFGLVTPFITIFVILIVAWVIALVVIGGATTLGYASFNLNIVDYKDAKFKDLFSQYHRIGAGFCMQFLRGLYTFLWTLLFIIPGIIAGLSYSMTPYIMAENPELGANDAIGYSKEMMRGNKWRLFCLQFSFLGWILLTIFTCGIGMIVLNPYMEAAMAAFYREVSGTYQQNNQSSYYGGYQQNQYYGQNQYEQNQYQQNPYNQNQNGQNQYQQDQYSGNQYQQNQYQQNQYQQNQYQQPQHVVDPFQQQYSSNQFQQEPYDFAQHHGSDEQHNDFDQMDIDSNAGDMHEADLHEMDQPDMDIDMSTDSTGDQSND